MSELEYVHIAPEWADELEALELTCFPTSDPTDLYDAAELRDLCEVFPEGGFVVLDAGRPVAMGLGIRVHFDFEHYQHSIGELVDSSGHHGHAGDGEWYYGTDIAVHPDYRRRGIGQRLYDLRKQVCREFNLRGIVAGGVIPGFADHKHEMTATEYVSRVATGDLYDPTLSFQIENGFEARGAIADYIRDDAVDSWASLIVWDNPGHVPSGVVA
ncbi:MAG: GNAT family N-acetyltransferase [Acidimicrobiales bacterium]